MTPGTLGVGGGLVESVGQVAALAGTLVLVLVIVGFGWFAYKSLRGDGVEWPDEDREEAVERGGDDDEWKYY